MPQVLQVIQQGRLRGAEVFALDLSRALVRHGTWGVKLFSLFDVDRVYADMSARAGVPLSAGGLDGDRRGLRIAIVRNLASTIDRDGYQIVQANGAGTLKYLVAARLLSRRPWRLVYRAIGFGSFWRPGVSKRTLYRWLLSRADLVIAVSRAVADDLLASSSVRRRQLRVIPNGVEPNRVQSNAKDRDGTRTRLGVTASEVLLLWVGSLTEEKNPTEFVEVVSHCRGRGLPVKGVLIGEGALRDSLTDTVRRRGLYEEVHLLPQQETIGPFLAASDLFVLPSRTEGMPAVLLEAAMAGLPAVAYAVGGVPEAVQDKVSGILVPPGEFAAFAREVEMLAGDGLTRVRMGLAARTSAAAYDIANVASAYRNAYEGLLGRIDA